MFLTVLLLIELTVPNVQAKTEYPNQNQFPSVMELALLRELSIPILETMQAHGDNQITIAERIEKIHWNETDDYHDITLRAIGFTGAHNPPYTLIRITFRTPNRYNPNKANSVIHYEHRKITPKEFDKLSKHTQYNP